MTFLNFLAWAFYWTRLELAALQQPLAAVRVTRERGRWRVVFGESSGEGREAWCAIRHLLEGRDESEPLEFSPEALAKQAAELELAQENARALEAARELERQDLEDLGELADTGAGDVAGDLESEER